MSRTETMRRAIRHSPRGHWPRAEASGGVTLDFDARHRRRVRLDLDEGGEILLDLERAVAMAGGDGLELEAGGWIEVRAASEPLMEIRADDPLLFARLAWHLGNRHIPTEIGAGLIHIRPDHVLEALLIKLGATVRHVNAPFQPEGGAYEDHGHHHDHAEDHDHHHGQGRGDDRDHDKGDGHGH
jgi:urease accessory protein